MVTIRSCIACNSADCVFAGARLISSASRNDVNTGPRTSVNSLRARLKTLVPVNVAGIRSGGNWMRANSHPSTCASVRASHVLATPGHALDQRMLPREDHNERRIDRVILPEYHFAHFFASGRQG